MGLFSLSRAGKNARGQSDEIAYLLANQGRQAFDRSGRFFGRGEQLSDEALNYYRNLVEQGFANPEEIAGLGSRALPGREDLMARRGERLQSQMTELGNIPTAGQTVGERSRTINESIQDAINQQAAEQGIVGERRGALSADEAAYTQAIQNRIRESLGGARERTKGTFAGARERAKGTFGAAQQNVRDLYGGLERGAGSAFDQAISAVRPGSEARVATSARAFAPQEARVRGRLRRAGIDESSPEAASLLSSVEGQRSRALDDALSGAIEQEANLRLGKFGAQAGFRERGGQQGIGLSLQELQQQTGLDLGELSQLTGLDQEELAGLNEEQRRNLVARAGITREAAGGELEARRGFFGNLQGVRNVQLNEPLLARGLTEEDIGRYNAQLDKLNQEELLGRGLQQEEFGIGQGLAERNLAARGAGAAGVERGGTQAFGVGAGQQEFGQQASQSGNQLLQNILAREQASSGLGTRILGGLASTALGAFTGGFGNVATRGLSQLGSRVAGRIFGGAAAPGRYGAMDLGNLGRRPNLNLGARMY